MDLALLEKLMVEYGAVIRAIPKTVTSILEARHKKNFPNGVIKHLDTFKRDMLVVETTPVNAGRFLLETAKHTHGNVKFDGLHYFDSIQEIAEYLSSRV